MRSSLCEITLNKIFIIPQQSMGGMHIFSFMDEGIPYGWFDIIDTSGAAFALFNNLSIGTNVKIQLIDKDLTTTYNFDDFVIIQIENSFETDASKFAGTIRVWIGHPWFLYKDIKNHAYAPTNTSKLIRKILESKDRGVAFKVNKDEDFSETDEGNGKLTRYKISETDWEFIQNKLLPYATIKQQPVHFYHSFKSFFLHSFKEIYAQKPIMMFIPSEGNVTTPLEQDKFDKIASDNNIDNGSITNIRSAYISIGSPEILQEIYPAFSFEELSDGTYIDGQKQSGNFVSKKSGTSFGNKLPINVNYMMQSTGSSTKIIRNRQATDAFSLLFSSSQKLDNMFSLVLITPFNFLTIGHTVYVFCNPLEINPSDKKNGTKEHWLNGLWLVSGVEHYSDEIDKTMIMSKTYLVRPSFVGNEKNTSLAYYQYLYEAK